MRPFTQLFALVAFATFPAAAQTTGADWRPFRVGHTYYYAAGVRQDSIISVRLLPNPLVAVNGDTTWLFPPVLRPVAPTGIPGGCPPVLFMQFFYTHRLSQDIEFGQRLTAQSGGRYTFSTSDSLTFQLQTRGIVGSAWAFAPGITATLTARTMAVVALDAPAIQDSVLIISLSTGGRLVLSKQYGLISSPDLVGIGQGQAVVAPLVLQSLPSRNLGLPPSHPWRIYDFQPGDEFGFKGETSPGGATWVCARNYLRLKVISRALNSSGDTLIYAIRQQERIEDYSSPTNPSCHGTGPTTTVSPVQTTELRFPLYSGTVPSLLLAPRESTLTSAGLPELGTGIDQRNAGTHRDSVFTGCWTRHYLTHTRTTVFDPCLFMFGGILDQTGSSITLADGLGWVSRFVEHFDGFTTDTHMVWHVKNGVACGSAVNFPVGPLGVAVLLPASAVQLYPNPASVTASARLHLTGLKGGLLTLTATDALGRRVWQQAQTVGPDADLALPTAAWVPGVYYVRVSLPEGARVVRVVRE
jgi:hypothetical protein